MEILVVTKAISMSEIKKLAQESFGDMVKAVVDVERKIMAVGGGLHADAEAALLKVGSKLGDVWGINLYPDRPVGEWIEFESLINVRPQEHNRSMEIQDPARRESITSIVKQLIVR